MEYKCVALIYMYKEILRNFAKEFEKFSNQLCSQTCNKPITFSKGKQKNILEQFKIECLLLFERMS